MFHDNKSLYTGVSLRHSSLGTASFVLALNNCAVIIGFVVISFAIFFLQPDLVTGPPSDAVVAGFMATDLLGTVLLPGVGVIVGVVGLRNGSRRRVLAVVGLVFNAGTLLSALALIAVYISLLSLIEHAIAL